MRHGSYVTWLHLSALAWLGYSRLVAGDEIATIRAKNARRKLMGY